MRNRLLKIGLTGAVVAAGVGLLIYSSLADAEYFLAWIDRIRESVVAHEDFNSDAEQLAILDNLDAASRRFEMCR